MNTYTRYASRTGEILDIIIIPDSAYDYHSTLLFDGEVDGDTHYIVDGEPMARPIQPTVADKTDVLANGEDAVIISSVPSGAMLSVSGPVTITPQPIEDGAAELAFDVPGDYVVRVDLFPYLPWQVSISAS